MFLNKCWPKSPATIVSTRHRVFKATKMANWLSLFTVLLLLIIGPNLPNAEAQLDRISVQQPIFIKNMDSFTLRENTPVGEIVYTLEAQLERPSTGLAGGQSLRIAYGIEGTNLFSVDKFTGQVRVAQLIDREQTSDSVTFQVSATMLLVSSNNQKASQIFGPKTQLTITVIILDENDNPPKIERVRVGRTDYDSLTLARQLFIGNSLLSPAGLLVSQRSPIIRMNLSESSPMDSVVVDLIEAIDVDKASSNPLRSICLDCDPEFELRSASDNLLNDRLNSSIVLINPLIHVPRNNIRHLHVVVNDGKFNSTIQFEITIDDVQNRAPQFVGSSSCIVHENVPIDKTILTLQAIDGDAIGFDESSLPAKSFQGAGRQILYSLLSSDGAQITTVDEGFKLHPLSGQLQVANRLDREMYLSSKGVLQLRVRARELTVSAETVIGQDDPYDSILEKLLPFADPSGDAISDTLITVILIDVNDNGPHWLNASEIAVLNMNQSPNWYSNLPNDRDLGRIYQLQVKENSPAGSPINTQNEMFVYDLDNGDNAKFNLTLVDPFNLFDVEPKQVSGFALVTLKLASNLNRASQQSLRNKRAQTMLDYENPNERSFIIQLIATEVSTNERFSSKAQIQINVLDVNDNAPEFREPYYHRTIREDIAAGSKVLEVEATDKDESSKQLVYSLHGRSSHLFDINRLTGLITVARCDQNVYPQVSPRLRSPLGSQQSQLGSIKNQCIDYEQQRSHHLMVEVSDGKFSNEVPFTVFIEDASDNPPIFALPVVDVVIEEGADRLDPPIRIEATDVDQSSVLTYSIIEGNFEGLFEMNNATGELQLTRPIRISHEDLISGGNDYRQAQLNKMTLIVQATDGLFSANGTIRIDVLDANDNAPKFIKPQYQAEISESISAGQMVATVRAIDSDRGNNARVSYKLQRGSYGQFEIDETTGVVSISRQAREFDSSKRDNYTLEVVAFDHGLVSKSSSVFVHVQVLPTNKRPPKFRPQIQRAKVIETTLNNTIIHRMSVQENQQAAASSAPLLIFEPGPIDALDKNGQSVGSSESERERLESLFSVSTNTGDVMVNSDLDHDFAAHINLTIYVSGRQFAAPSMLANNSAGLIEPPAVEEYNPRSVGYLIITIIDDNGNAPIFAAPWTPQQPELAYQMLEELPVGSVLTQLVASDADSRISYFKIEPANEYFDLASPQSGTIVNKKLIDYDTLMSQTFLTPGAHRLSTLASSAGNNIIQFNVYVYDSGQPQLSAKATVSVEILPVNDNDCKFEQSIYEVRVRENSQPDTLVAQVRANDLDFGEQHNSVRYQLIGDHSDLFNIDPRTGLITVSNKGSKYLDRERLSQATFALTVLGRDEPQPAAVAAGGKSSREVLVRTCSATLKVYVDDVNDNPPLFTQKLYEVTAYDTDTIDVPLIKLMIRDDDSISMSNNSMLNATSSSKLNHSNAPQANSFKIISGNINDSFNITNTGLVYATKPLNASLAPANGPFQLRIQVKQPAAASPKGAQASFTDECLVKVNFIKINRYGPEWRLDSIKAISVEENSKIGTLVAQLKCFDRDYETKGSNMRLISDSDEDTAIDAVGDFERPNETKLGNQGAAIKSSPIRYWIRSNGSNVLETNEFKLDSVSGKLTTKIELDREKQFYYQLVVVCEDNGKPQSLESVAPLPITVLDVDDNQPQFLIQRAQETSDPIRLAAAGSKAGKKKPQTISFFVEEHQSKGLPIGELKAIDRDLESSSNPISYCLLEGNEFQEFALDRATGILYTNQTLDRERQSFYDLLVKAINDGSNCEDHQITPGGKKPDQHSANSSSLSMENNVKRHAFHPTEADLEPLGSYLVVKINVLDINDNAPIFKRPIYRAGVHHRSLMSTLITQVAAFDPDSGLNGSLSYKISEILMYKTSPSQHQQQQLAASRSKYDVVINEPAQTLSKPIRLIQFPFRIDQQGNLYTQQLMTQYQLMSMFVLNIEASEQAEPWRTARTKLEVYVYETSSQLKIRINLHPKFVDLYRTEIENLLSNATKYTAIINRARSYHDAFAEANDLSASKLRPSINVTPTIVHPNPYQSQNDHQHQPVPTQAQAGDELSFSNIHLVFVDNFKIVNPNLVMEKFDLTSAQLFMPQMLIQNGANINNEPANNQQQYQRNSDQLLQLNEMSSLIDKIALASVQPAEYHSSAFTLAGIEWLESPSIVYVSLTVVLLLIGFIGFLFGCCCTSRIKDHIVKVAMDKLVKQQTIQAKINEQMIAATNQANMRNGANSGAQDYMLQQGGFMSSFDATKGCVTNNQENMNILQRAMESGEFVDPNYTTLNGHINMGAHYYDGPELDVANGGQRELEVGTSKQINDGSANDSISFGDQVEEDDLSNGQLMKRSNLGGPANGINGHQQQHARQRQQIPSNSNGSNS